MSLVRRFLQWLSMQEDFGGQDGEDGPDEDEQDEQDTER